MFEASVANSGKEARIELHIDKVNGTLVSTLPINYTEGKWKTEKAVVTNCSGVHDLYLVFRGEYGNKTLFKFDYWKMTPKTSTRTLIGINVH